MGSSEVKERETEGQQGDAQKNVERQGVNCAMNLCLEMV